ELCPSPRGETGTRRLWTLRLAAWKSPPCWSASETGAPRFSFDTQPSTFNTQPVPLPPDCHMHTPLCRHASGEPVDYARRALEVGLTEIGFTDHSPMARDDFDDWRMRNDQLDEYVEKVVAHPPV